MSTVELPVAVSFEIPRVPPSWANRRDWWSERYKRMEAWRSEAWFRAAAARVEAGWPSPSTWDAKRLVTVVQHRCRLLDEDNLAGSCKPILDGLKGQLLRDDSPKYCALKVSQVKVGRLIEQRCVISVEAV